MRRPGRASRPGGMDENYGGGPKFHSLTFQLLLLLPSKLDVSRQSFEYRDDDDDDVNKTTKNEGRREGTREGRRGPPTAATWPLSRCLSPLLAFIQFGLRRRFLSDFARTEVGSELNFGQKIKTKGGGGKLAQFALSSSLWRPSLIRSVFSILREQKPLPFFQS